MTPEVVMQVAERLVSNSWDTYIGEPDRRNWMDIAGAILADGRAVARAWLAEHPSDDATPVDTAWADGIGWESSYGFYWPVGDRTILLVVRHDATPILSYTGRVVAEPATRGHVRRIAVAIGRPLAPTSAPSA